MTRAARLRVLTDILFQELEAIADVLDDATMDRLVADLVRDELDAAERRREAGDVRGADEAEQAAADVRARRARLQRDLSERRYDEAELALRRLIRDRGLDIDLADPAARPLMRRATRGLVAASHTDERREHGIYDAPPTGAAPPESAAGAPAAASAAPDPPAASPGPAPAPAASRGGAPSANARAGASSSAAPAADRAPGRPAGAADGPDSDRPARGITLADAWARFADDQPSRDMARAVHSCADLVTGILGGDMPLADVTPSHIQTVRDILARLPKNHGKSRRETAPPREVADAADAREREERQHLDEQFEFSRIDRKTYDLKTDQVRVPRISPQQVNNHLDRITGLFKFAKRHGWVAGDAPTTGLRLSKSAIRRGKTAGHTAARRPWGVDGLQQLFATSIFTSVNRAEGEPLFWAPLMGVHTGCRCEELLQAQVTDFQTVEDVPCLHIRPGDGRHIKTPNAERCIPLHSLLLEAGLLDLVAKRKREGAVWLFPMLDRGAVDDTFTEKFTKRFTRYRREEGIYDPRNDFHSLRSDFNALLARSGVPLAARQRLMGHEVRELADSNYDPNGEPMPERRRFVEHLDIGMALTWQDGMPLLTPATAAAAA